jgi:hypothetical protein
MPGSLSVLRKNAAKARQKAQITRGQTLSTRKPGFFEGIYDYVDRPLAALAQRLGMSEADAYEYSKRLSGGIEGITGAKETETATRKVAKGKGDAGDYMTLGMAVLPGAIGAGARKAKTALRGAKASKEAKLAARPKYKRSEEGDFLRVERKGVQPQIIPEAKEAKSIDELRTILKNPETNPAARAADEYTRRELGRKYDIDMPTPGTSLEKQSGIARVFEAGVEGSPEYKQALFEAYGLQMPEIVEQAGAQNYDELLESAYRQLGEETKKQFAAMPVKTAYHYGPGEYATPSAMLRDVLSEGNLNVYRGGDPHEFLNEVDPDTDLTLNEMFRAVHDLYGHGTMGSTFRPGGEEIAYASHSQMMSPLAQMALLSETRGQNSLVNYSPLNVALFEKRRPIINEIEELKRMDRMRGQPGASAAEINQLNAQLRELGAETNYAPQSTLLLPPEYLPPETTGGVPEYLREVIKARSPSSPERAVHLSRAEGLTATDPSFYGTGHRGVDYAMRGKKGSPEAQTSFYLGEEGTVIPEAVVADISPYAYEARLKDLYDINEDPESLVRLANALAKRNESSLPDLARMIREYGYKGYRTSDFVSTPGQGAAAVFEPVDLLRAIERGPKGYEEGGLAHSSSSPGNMN